MSAGATLLGTALGVAGLAAARTTLRSHRARRRLADAPTSPPGDVPAGVRANGATGTGTTGTGIAGTAGAGSVAPPPLGIALAWRSPRLAVVAGIAAATVVLVWGPGLLLALGAAGGAGAVAWQRRRAAAWAELRRSQLPVALDRLASALRGGSSVPAALAGAGEGVPSPLGPELAALGRQADGGRAVGDVLDAWAARHPDPGTRLAATALVLATVVGATPARAADGVAATLRERAGLAAERRALGAQARMSGLVLSVAPVGFAALLATTDAAAARFLLGSAAGWACLGVGLALDVAGAWWMSRLTTGSDR